MTGNKPGEKLENGHLMPEVIFHMLFGADPQPPCSSGGQDHEAVYLSAEPAILAQLLNWPEIHDWLQAQIPGYTAENSKEALKVEFTDQTVYISVRKNDLVLSSDITAIPDVQRERITLLRKLFDAQQDNRQGCWYGRPDQDLAVWSAGMFEIFGKDPAGFMPTCQNMMACFHAEEQPVLHEAFDLILKGTAVTDFEQRIFDGQGELRWVSHQMELHSSPGRSIPVIFGKLRDVTEKKKADENFRALFENTSDAVLMADDQGNCLDFNDAVIAMFGYSRQQLKQIDLRQLLQAGFTARYADIWERFISGQILNETMILKRKNGADILINLKAGHRMHSGTHLCVMTDITDRIKKTKKTLNEDRRFAALVQEGADLIAVTDQDGIYSFVSESSHSVLGIYPEELVGKNAFDFIHPDDQIRIFRLYGELSEHKRLKSGPFRLIDSNGRWKWLSAVMTNLTGDDAVDGIIINAKDITESVRKTNALRLSHQRYQLIIKAANEAIYDWDIKKAKVEWGVGYHDVFGYDAGAYHHMLWYDHVHSQDQSRIRAELEAAVQDSSIEILVTECRFNKANGDVALVEHRIIFLRDKNGIAVRAVGALRDVTELKQNLVRIEHQNERLRQIAWAQSHLVRAPLSRMMASIDLIKNYENSDSEKMELLDLINIAALEFEKIISDISAKADPV